MIEDVPPVSPTEPSSEEAVVPPAEMPVSADAALSVEGIEAVSPIEPPPVETLASNDGALSAVEVQAILDKAAQPEAAAEHERKPKPQPTFRDWLARLLGRSPEEDSEARLWELERAIEDAPNTPSNYVIRGELYLATRQYQEARADFQRGFELAAAQVAENDWGIVAQVIQDRALIGLQKAERRLRR